MAPRSRRLQFLLIVSVVIAAAVARPHAQASAPVAPPAAAARPKDTLGRETPRGTVLGFMRAAAKANDDVAPLYLNTTLRDKAAVDLAHKLYVVLDSRLPARLNELSDRPEGSLPNPLKADQDVIGTVSTANGRLDLIV